MRQAMGVAVFSGMLGVTVFGLLLTPAFYVMVRAWTGRVTAEPGPRSVAGPGPGGHA
jgi:hypothetical protein